MTCHSSKANLINDFIVIFLFFCTGYRTLADPPCPLHQRPCSAAASRFMRILFLCVGVRVCVCECVCVCICLGGWTCSSMVWALASFECQRNGCSDYQKLILLSAFVSQSLPPPPLSSTHASASHCHTSFSRNTFATHTNNKSCKNFNFPSIFLAFHAAGDICVANKIHKHTHTQREILHMYMVYI